jgi:RND family efflux transporter MFP subunit
MGNGRRRALSALLGLSLLGGCRSEPNPEVAPLPIDTTPATTTAFAEQVTTISTLEAVEAVQLAAQAGGRIKELRIRQGDRVRAGELLLVLDQAQLQAELTSLRAALAKDRLNYQRYEYLVRAGAASAIERDELAQAVVASTAKLKQREADLAFRDLRSPIDGTISDVKVKAGDVISAGDPFTSVIRNGELNARIDVPARYRGQLRLGQPVDLEDPGTAMPLAHGVVISIDPSVNAGTQVLLVKARFSSENGNLQNGLRVRTRVVFQRRQELSVPVGSVIQSSAQSYVFRVGSISDLERNPGQAPLAELRRLPPGSSFALQTRVSLGPLQNGRYPVLRGLSAGDAVITSNLLNLRHGTPVSAGGS